MKILLVPSTDWTSPLVFRHRMLAKFWSDSGHEVHVLHINLNDGKASSSTEPAIVLHRVEGLHKTNDGLQNELLHYAANGRTYWTATKRILRSNNIDVIVSANLLPSLWVSLLASREGIPVVYDTVDYYPDFVYRYNLGEGLSKLVRVCATDIMVANLRMATALVTPSASLASYLGKTFKPAVDGKPFHVVSNGVDLSLFDPHRYESEQNVKSGAKVLNLLYVGSLEFWLDTRFIVGVASELRKAGYRPLVTVAGTEPSYYQGRVREQLSREARAAGLPADSIGLKGHIPYASIPETISRTDACLLPFRSDLLVSQFACPLKLFEYLAMGKPILSTDLGEVKRIAGTTITATDYAAEGARELLGQIESASRSSSEAHLSRNLAAKHDWAQLARDFIGLLKTC